MGMLIYIIDFALTIGFLWLGMKLMQVYSGAGWSGQSCSIKNIAIASVASTVVTIIPFIGGILSFVVLLILLIKYTKASLKHVIIMVLSARLIAYLCVLFIR